MTKGLIPNKHSLALIYVLLKGLVIIKKNRKGNEKHDAQL